MNPAIDLIKGEVCLQSYTSSKGYLGFFERKVRYSPEVARRALDLFWGLDLLADAAAEVAVISSFYVVATPTQWKKRVGYTKEEAAEIRSLARAGFVRMVDPESLKSDEDYEDLAYDFVLNEPVERELLDRISRACFRLPVQGRCFLLFDSLNLIVYPHDDTGFGFIGYGERPREHLAQLSTAFSDPAFDERWEGFAPYCDPAKCHVKRLCQFEWK